ncbi:beta-1,4-N-acetylgalactosaminyltransferase bre-4 isoform X3 [Dendroctonus ponderosae]
MPPCLLQSTPYKGLFILVLLFVALEYIFNTVSETRTDIFNSSTKVEFLEKSAIHYGPLLKTLLFKAYSKNMSCIQQARRLNSQAHLKAGNFAVSISNLDYVVTIPPFLIWNITEIYTNNYSVESPASTFSNKVNIDNGTSELERSSQDGTLCPDVSQNLYGRVQIQTYPVPSVQTLESRFSWLQPGGHWAPSNCTVEKKVAIIIPFRSRGEHLLLFLQHMHPFLKKQQLDYTIFVVEQDGEGPFNRAMLMNIGYIEGLKARTYDCFIFHDVDLLPEDDRNLYTCPEQPRHMSVAVDMFNYRLPYPAIFGGVSAISRAHFKLLNGFSNSFWGWGGEDDDMSNRIRHHQLYISRYPITIARYTMLTHKKDLPNPHRYDVLRKGQQLFDTDGLNSLKYQLLMRKEKLLYTWILVKLSSQHRR